MLLAQTESSVPVVTGDAKVDRLLNRMTLAEKISMIHGAIEDAKTDQGQAGYLPGIPRLGIPSLRLADGPPGVLTRIPATGLTTTLGLAATFSVQDAEQNGVAIARDARSLGIDIVLEPFINMYRVMGGRNANTYGEDPLLTGLIGAGLIKGVQSQGVMAQAKHFIAYEGANDVIVDPQTLHEVYLAPFFDAIDAGVSSAMCAYNKVNGSYACGNDETQNTFLRGETGWKGFITSDWGATHATDFINRGLDLEMPGGSTGAMSMPSFFTPDPAQPAAARGGGTAGGFFMGRGGIPEETPRVANASAPGRGRGGPGRGQDPPSIGMLNAVQQGIVKEEAITRAVGRILFQMDKFEFLDKPPKHEVTPIRTEANAPIVRKTAEDAAVLLKNEGDALPLTAADLQSVALIGPGARQTVAIGQYGERATGIPSRQIGAAEAIHKTAPNAKVTLAVADDMTGVPVPASALSHDGQPGLLRTGTEAKSTHVDPDLNFTTANNKKALPVAKSYHWTGSLTIAKDGEYILALQVMGTGGTLTVDGNQLASTGNPMGNMHGNTIKAEHDLLPTTDGLDSLRRRVDLKAGVHAIDIESMADTSGAPVEVRLNWITPEQQKADYDAAIAAAKQARKAVVFVWGRGSGMAAMMGGDSGEARLNALPGDQNKLIDDVLAVNPNTIVVMNVVEPTDMPWFGKVKSVLQMWWTGDEGGWAAANLLLGKVSPAGRLPYTWPKTADQMLNHDPAHPERASNPAGPTTYSEGVNIGYRYFDNEKKEPLFPFGYGLSYTKFEYAGLKAVKAKDGGLDVSFTIRNTGKAASDEVPQVYLGAPKQPPQNVQFAPKTLAAFERIALKPGESRPVTLHVAPRRLQYWSVSANKWVTATGTRTVHIGASSRDLRLQADVNI